jgi:hypothetical protein
VKKIDVPADVQRLWNAYDAAKLEQRIDRLTKRLESLSLPMAPTPAAGPCDGCKAACPGKSDCTWHAAGRRPAGF